GRSTLENSQTKLTRPEDMPEHASRLARPAPDAAREVDHERELGHNDLVSLGYASAARNFAAGAAAAGSRRRGPSRRRATAATPPGISRRSACRRRSSAADAPPERT